MKVKNWQHGDPLALDVKFYLFENTEYFFKNLRLNTSLQINGPWDSQIAPHTIYTIEEISSRFIILDDGSVWRMDFFTKNINFGNWKKGDQIIIFFAPDLFGYYLINLNSNNEKHLVYSCTGYLIQMFNKEKLNFRYFITEIGSNLIKLNNDIRFKPTSSLLELFQINKTKTDYFQIGDEVCVYINFYRDKDGDEYCSYYLINMRNLHEIKVCRPQLELGFFAYKIDDIVIKKKKIELLFSQQNKIIFDYALITLNDGSCWKTDDSSVEKWGKGDSILISQNINTTFKDPAYLLVNTDCESEWDSVVFWARSMVCDVLP